MSSRVSESITGFFHFPAWDLLLGVKHQIEGTNDFYCLFRKTQAKWGELNCPSFEMAEVVSNPVPFSRKPNALPPPPCPNLCCRLLLTKSYGSKSIHCFLHDSRHLDMCLLHSTASVKNCDYVPVSLCSPQKYQLK